MLHSICIHTILLAITLSSNFLISPSMHIGLYLSGFPGLGMSTRFASFYTPGKIPLLRHALNVPPIIDILIRA